MTLPPASASNQRFALPRSFADVLQIRLRREPGQPLVTFYDDETGERTELSVTTYANWVAKSAGVLTDDLDLVGPDRIRIDLPGNWLGPVFLGAAWLAGLEVTTGDAEAVISGPDGDGDLVCSLHPFALPVAGSIAGEDFGLLWPNQPDAFLGVPGGAADPAYDGRTQQDLLVDVRPSPDRVLTDLNPVQPEGVRLFLDTLVGGGSVVWVAHSSPERWDERATSERADRKVRA